MRWKLWLLVLVGAMMLSVTPVLADGDFYVIGGGGGVGTKITSLPFIIDNAGFYYLTKNLSYSGTNNAITITTDDVTLDLMGFCLTGPDSGPGSPNSCGIYIQANCTNVEIRNGSLKNFRNAGSGGGGIRGETGTSGIRVIGVRAQGIYGEGIGLYGTDNIVTGCSVMTSSIGIQVGYGSIVKGNHVAENTTGITAYNGCTIIGNVFKSNIGCGIYTYDACSVLDNSLLNNGQSGIFTGNYCTITRNTANGDSSVGIRAGNHCTITNNTTQGLTKGTDCTDMQNTVY